MKKRILSILLAALMVMSVVTIVLPTTVSAAVSNNYSYKFESTDARNYVVGQVVDIGVNGEAAVAPAMNGSLAAYQVSTEFESSSGSTMPVYYAVKDGYLYAAIVANDTKQVPVFWEITYHKHHN